MRALHTTPSLVPTSKLSLARYGYELSTVSSRYTSIGKLAH